MATEEKDVAKYASPEELFNQFCDAEEFLEILHYFKQLCRSLQITSVEGIAFYRKLKSCLRSWKCQALWDLLDARANHSTYGQGKFGENVRVFVIGSGPIGLRTAIECALLGCKVVLVEKRTSFTRNNVLHLWSFLLHDFRALGAKKFYGKFGSGSIDHVSIRVLQAVLLKTTLILGVQVFSGITFEKLVEPSSSEDGWRAKCSPENHPVNKWKFNVIIGADGKKDVLPGFQQIEMRGKVAIGITCNFINYNTIEEANVQEISGIAYQFKPSFFDSLFAKQGVRLENIVYYKDATHYFVMTAIKTSLLERGVLKQDFSDPAKLLERSNIDQDELVSYTCDAVNFATDYQLPKLDLMELPNGYPDIALFDFTSIKKASNACRIVERKGQKLLLALVGDSLLEPFWPTGSGCGRGVLSALDTAWMIRQYGKGYPPLYIIRDRENVFKLLSGTSNDNLQKNINAYTIDPKTRYSNVSSKKMMTAHQLKEYYDTDDPENADYSIAIPDERGAFEIGVRYPINKHKAGRRKSGGRRRSSSRGRSRRKSDRLEPKASKASHAGEPKASGSTERPNKRSKPSGSRSGSASSELQSISESDLEGHSGSVASLTYSRQNSQTTHSSESRRGTLVSQSELDDVFLSSSLDKEGFAAPEKKARSSARDDLNERTKSWFRRKASQQKSHDSERKHAAARKSIGNAKKYRLRRQSTNQSTLTSSKEKENVKLIDVNRQGSKVKELREALVSEYSQGETSNNTKKPLEGKSSTGSMKNGKLLVKNGERVTVSKSCKELIAEAEARDKLKKEAMKGSSQAEEGALPRSLKRKAEDVNTANKRKSLNRDLGSLVGDIMNVESRSELDETMSTEKLFEVAVCRAAGILLAIPLLLKCDKTSNSNAVNKAKQDAPTNRSNTLKPSDSVGKKESEQFQRAGSVQKRRQEYLAMIERRESGKKDYHEFKRSKASGSQINENDPETSSLLSTSSRASSNMEQTDFVAKDVIDAETCFLNDGEESRRNSDFVDGPTKNVGITDDPLRCRDSVETVLERLKEELKPSAQVVAIKILLSIHKNIQKNSNVDRYYRIHLMGEMFQKYIWNVHAARDFMEVVGWTRCGSFLLLSKSVIVDRTVADLDTTLRSVQESVAVGRMESLNYKVKRHGRPEGRKIRKWDSVPASAPRQINVKPVIDLDNLINDLEESLVDDMPDIDHLENSSEHVTTDSNYIGDNEYLVLSYNEKEPRMSTPVRSSKAREDALVMLTAEKEKMLKDDKKVLASDSKVGETNEIVSHVERKSVLNAEVTTTDKGIINKTRTGSESNTVLEKSERSDSKLSRDIAMVTTNDNISKADPSVAKDRSKSVVESGEERPPDSAYSHADVNSKKTGRERSRSRLALSLGVGKSSRDKKKTKSSVSDQPLSPGTPDDRSDMDDRHFEVQTKKVTRKGRSGSRLSLGLGTRKSKKDKDKGVQSPTSESENPLSPTEATPTKKKKKGLLRIVKKLKRQGSMSIDESPSLSPSDDNAHALSASWANITEEGEVLETKNAVPQDMVDGKRDEATNGTRIKTNETNTDNDSRRSYASSGNRGSGASNVRFPEDLLQSDSGLCSTDENEAVPTQQGIGSSDEIETKPKKKKIRVLKIRKKKGLRDSGVVADISNGDSLERVKSETTPEVTAGPSKVSDQDIQKSKFFGKKKVKRDRSPPKGAGKLKPISTSPVDI